MVGHHCTKIAFRQHPIGSSPKIWQHPLGSSPYVGQHPIGSSPIVYSRELGGRGCAPVVRSGAPFPCEPGWRWAARFAPYTALSPKTNVGGLGGSPRPAPVAELELAAVVVRCWWWCMVGGWRDDSHDATHRSSVVVVMMPVFKGSSAQRAQQPETGKDLYTTPSPFPPRTSSLNQG